MKDSADPGYLSDELEFPDWRADDHDHDVSVDLINLDRDVGVGPHIRDPRTDCNGPGATSNYRPAKFGTRRSAIALTPSLKSSVTRRRFCSSSS